VPILILSHYGDAHASAIDWGLKQAGVDVVTATPSDIPHFGTAAVSIEAENIRIKLDRRTITDTDWGVVWNRRRGRFSPDKRRSPGETRYVEFETRQMVNGIYSVIEATYPMINRFSSEFVAANKIFQLVTAARLGISVPNTVIGNDFQQVNDCFSFDPPAFKSFRVPVWEGSDIFSEEGQHPRALIGMTAKLEPRHLKERGSIEACPGIYQSYVEKAYEVRVLWLDGNYIAAKINSQASELSQYDWRGNAFNVELEPIKLSDDIVKKLSQLMKALSLETGSIDLIVTPQGETVFLEVNPTGQFLWLDSQNDQFDSFGAMIRFLMAKAGISSEGRKIPVYGDYASSSLHKDWLTTMDAERYALHTETRYSDEKISA